MEQRNDQGTDQQPHQQSTSDEHGGQSATGQASYGNSGDHSAAPASDLSQGQASASDRGLGQEDTMTQDRAASADSTSAQRSGSQGSGDQSFAGSSLGGQNEADQGGPFMAKGTEDSSASYVSQEESGGQDFDRDGQGAGAKASGTDRTGDQARQSELDGE